MSFDSKNLEIDYFPHVDGLRALAVLSVIFFHFEIEAFAGGFIGVDIFFVISGFLITRLIVKQVESGRFKFSQFYLRRARRLFPALFFTWIISFVFSVLLFSAEHLERFGGALIYSVLSISNFYFWLEAGYFDADSLVKPLLHTWSLSVEEQFYLIWPFLLVLFISKLSKTAILVTISFICVSSLYISEIYLDTDRAAAFYLAPFRAIEFGMGALLVWFYTIKPNKNFILELLVIIGIGLIIYSIYKFDDQSSFPGLNVLIPAFGTLLLIYAGNSKYLGKLFTNKFSVGIGLISYSLYLIHWPMYVFYVYYHFQDVSMWEKFSLIIFSIIAAGLMYKFIEQPFRYIKNKESSMKPAAFGLTCSVLALLVSFGGAHVWANNGWTWRLNDHPISDKLVHNFNMVQSDSHKELTVSVSDGGANFFSVGSYNSQTAKKILVLGDSHAAHLQEGFDYLGKKYDLSFDFYTATGCPPVFGTFKVFGPGAIDNPPPRQLLCSQHTNIWEKYIGENKYDYVVLSSRWSWLYEPINYGAYNIRRDLLVEKSNPIYSVEASKDTFVKMLGYTVQEILNTQANVILFSQVPNNGKNLQGCDNVPSYLIDISKLITRCQGVTKEVALQRLNFTEEVIHYHANKERVHKVIPSRYFCEDDEDYCLLFYEGTKLYKDADHVNQYGSIYLVKRWESDPDFPFNN